MRVTIFLFAEEVRSTSQLLNDAQKSAADLEKAKRKVESERDETYGALEVCKNHRNSLPFLKKLTQLKVLFRCAMFF